MMIYTSGFVFILAIISACNRETTPACDCQGPPNKVLTDELVIYKQEGVRSVNNSEYYVLSCNPDFMKGKATNGDTILISGQARLPCFKGETLVMLPSLLEVTAARKP